MGVCFTKTELGRQELRARSLPLSRTARNLLFVIDAARPATEWLTLVQGATAEDLQMLQEAALIAPPAKPVAATEAPSPEPVRAPQAPESTLNYSELYEQLNAQIKRHLGLIKGYHFSLETEKAASLPELRDVAHRLVEEVHRIKGEREAQSIQMALGLVG